MDLTRNSGLSKNILFVDGQAGCGKTLFNRIFNSFNDIELYRYASEIENIATFYFKKKIDFDAAKFFLKFYTDETLYSQMMGRNTNFRYSDLSSVFQSKKKIQYIMRLFNKGDEIIPSIINLKEPILHFATHNLLPRSEILFKVFKDNLKFINIVRHPVYMVHQQAINHIEFTINSSRQFIQTFNYKKKEIPIFWEENPKEYLAIKNPFEKAIYQINKMNSLNKKIEQIIFKNYRKNYLKISFEKFVLNPQSYIQSIEKFLKVKFDKNVFKTMHYEKVPRSKIIDGRDVKIYRKYGWKRGSNKFSEREEINKKIEFFESKDVSQKYLNVLKKISDEYESNFLKGIIN